MNTKIQVARSLRVFLVATSLLALLFSTFGAGNISAHAQKASTNTPTIESSEISTTTPQVSGIPFYNGLIWGINESHTQELSIPGISEPVMLAGYLYKSTPFSSQGKPPSELLDYYSSKKMLTLGWTTIGSQDNPGSIRTTYYEKVNKRFLDIRIGECSSDIANSMNSLTNPFCAELWSSPSGISYEPILLEENNSSNYVPDAISPALPNSLSVSSFPNPLAVPFLSQRNSDPNNNITLGFGSNTVTIHDAGCALTSYAMIYNYYQPNFTSVIGLNNSMKIAPGSYACSGGACNLWPQNAPDAPAGVSFGSRYPNDCTTVNCFDNSSSHPYTALIDNELNSGRPIHLRVHPAGGPYNSHSVVLIGHVGNDYIIRDPWATDDRQRTLATGALGGYVVDYIDTIMGNPPGGGATNTPNPTLQPPQPTPQPGEWNVEYFNDTTITNKCSASNLISAGPFLFRDWGNGNPYSGCNSDNWSARFWRTVHFQSGTYNFGLGSDDWARLKIGADLVLNNWQGAGQHYASRNLSEGDYQVTVEFADTAGAARLAAWWRGPGYEMPTQARDPNRWYAQYWGNKELWWDSIVRVNDSTGPLSHSWGTGGPGYGLPSDGFSARFERQVYFSCGNYQFDISTDDGVRFWVDGSIQLDKWQDQSAPYSVIVPLLEGYHELKVDHYENGGSASISLNWSQLSACNTATATRTPTVHPTTTYTSTPTATSTISSCPTITAWKGEYWNNDSLTGLPVLCRNDPAINFHWAAGSPDPLISDNDFSVRWTRMVNFGEGTYTFSIFHDDGFRFYIDGSLVFENWSDSRAIEPYTTLLSSGNHEIKLEMYDGGGWADAELTWELNSSSTNTPTPTPTSTRTPTNTPLPGPLNTSLLNPSLSAPQTGGDNNGYEVNPVNAYANDSIFAIDNNSGANTNTSCTNSGKDKHRFYNYGISLPGTAVIQGIEVRLDAKVDSTSGSPKLCVQLSWDGGASWTAVKSTATLGAVEQTFMLGGITDTWGRAWTASQLSNTNFRVRVIPVASSTARDFSLDWISVRVTYR